MKKLLVLPLVALLFCMGCGTTRHVVKVGTDIKLGAPIKNFSTFGWMKDIKEIPRDQVLVSPTGVLVYNNESTRSEIKKDIKYELTARGFKQTDNDPDMLVNYIVFEQKGKLKTYQGYKVVGSDSLRTDKSAKTITVKPGTLFITLLGGHGEGVVWQGYASGIFTPKTVKDEKKIKSAVQRIFSKFDYSAIRQQ